MRGPGLGRWLRASTRRFTAASARLFGVGAVVMGVFYLYGVYSAVKRGIDVTNNVVRFEQIDRDLAQAQRELDRVAQTYRERASHEKDPLRATRLRQLADEADSMNGQVAELTSAVGEVKSGYKGVETLNNFFGHFGGDPGAVATPVLDQIFQLEQPGSMSATSVGEYFDRKLEIPLDDRLRGQLGTRLFQLTLEQAFRNCGVTEGNLGTTSDCVGGKLVLLMNQLGPQAQGSPELGAVLDRIRRLLQKDELKHALENRLKGKDLDPDAGAPDAGTSDEPADPEKEIERGPGSADEPEPWEGRWAGTSRTTVHVEGGPTVVQHRPMEMTTRKQGAGIVLTPTDGSGQPGTLNLSPSNPNVAKGTFEASGTRGFGGVTGSATNKTEVVAFLRDGRLYLTMEMRIQSTGTFMGKSSTSTTTSDLIAILDRLE